jgi:CRISPR-associated protein Cas5
LNLSENMIYGMIENICEFHFDVELRNEIVKILKLEKLSKRTEDQKTNLAYRPIINNICKIEKIDVCDEHMTFNDIFLSHMQRNDGQSHFNASSRDFSIENDKYDENFGYKNESSINCIHSVKGGKISNYYTSPNHREYAIFNGVIFIDLLITDSFNKFILNKFEKNKTVYLGNSESIINLKIENV